LASAIGAPGLGGLLILSAGSLAALLAARGEPFRIVLVGVFPLLLMVGLILDAMRADPGPATGPKLLLVQPNISQAEKMGAGGLQASIVKLMRLSADALAANPDAKAVVWPEAAVEYPLEEAPELRLELAAMLKPGQLLLTGGVAIERNSAGEATAARNSLYALDHEGRILMRYDKAHLVPGGEYLPLRWLAEPLGLSRLVPGTLDFLPGPGPKTFHLPGLPAMGPAICYEIIFPGAVVDALDRPGFILTVSSDAWFGASGPPQHFAQARLRAIEEGLPVARVTPTGISGLIGSDGTVLDSVPMNKAAVIAAPLPAAKAPTLFAQAGLFSPGVFALLLFAAGLFARRIKT
jgi:apolipoprotein N-acyltransferase